MKPILFSLLGLFFTGCRTLGGIGGLSEIPSIGRTSSKPKRFSAISKEQKILLSNLRILKDRSEAKECKSLGVVEEKTTGIISDVLRAKKALRHSAITKEVDSILYLERSNNDTVSAEIFRCLQEKPSIFQLVQQKEQLHQNSDFSIFGGAYFSREGILKKLGEVGPTFGLSVSDFFVPKTDEIGKHGFFLLWTFDHFWETNSKLLRPKFFNENYTNYMVAGGYAFRLIPTKWFQLHYKGGLAFNFIEIDTFGPGDAEKDREYSDVTVSTVHKIGVDFLIRKVDDIVYQRQLRFGPNIFYYFSPDPLGKFSNDEDDYQTGGSWAWSVDLKMEFY